MIYDIPKPLLSAALQTATLLSRLPNGDFATRICVGADKGAGFIRYNNRPYEFILRFPLSNPVEDFLLVCPISTFSKMLSASSNVVSIRKFEASYVVLLDGGATVALDTIVGADADYTHEFKGVCGYREIDPVGFKKSLTSMTALLPAAVSVADKCLIFKSGHTYVNVGSVLGRSENVFGVDFSISKYMLDALAPMMQFADHITCGLSTHMELQFGTESCVSVYLQFPVTYDPSVLGSFLSPLFMRAFDAPSGKAFTLPVGSIVGHLKAVGSLEYYESIVRLSVSLAYVGMQVECTNGPAFDMSYAMTSGSGEPGSIRVPIKVLTTILDFVGEDACFTMTQSGLLVSPTHATFCIRSV